MKAYHFKNTILTPLLTPSLTPLLLIIKKFTKKLEELLLTFLFQVLFFIKIFCIGFIKTLCQGLVQGSCPGVLSRGLIQGSYSLEYRYPTQLSISHSFLDIYEKGAFSGVRVNLIYLMKGYKRVAGVMTSSVPQYPGHRDQPGHQQVKNKRRLPASRQRDSTKLHTEETRQRYQTKLHTEETRQRTQYPQTL